MENSRPALSRFYLVTLRAMAQSHKIDIVKIALASLMLSGVQILLFSVFFEFLGMILIPESASISAINIAGTRIDLQKMLLAMLDWFGMVRLDANTHSIAVMTYFIVVFLAIGSILLFVFRFLVSYLIKKLGLSYLGKLRQRLVKALISMSYMQIMQRDPGYWKSVIMNDFLSIQQKIQNINESFILNFTRIAAIWLLIFTTHATYGLLFLTIIPVLGIVLFKITKKISRYATKVQESIAYMNSTILELRRRFEFIRVHRGEQREQNSFNLYNSRFFEHAKKTIFLRSIFIPGVELLGVVFVLSFLLLSRSDVGEQGFMLFKGFILLAASISPIKEIFDQINRISEVEGIWNNIPADIKGVERQARSPSSANIASKVLPTNIDLTHVELFYEDNYLIRLNNISLVPGMSYAFVGESGSGKSTILRVFAGVYTPSRWEGNVDYQDFVGSCSYLSQAAYFFDGSVQDNLWYQNFSRNNQLSDALNKGVLRPDAAELLVQDNGYLHELLESFGLLQFSPDAGVMDVANLSGGEKSRIAIIREILRNKEIWLFDEMTAALDRQNEENILKMLIDMTKKDKKILVVSSHHGHILPMFDHIFFLQDGVLKDQGSHSLLLERNSAYSQMWHGENNQVERLNKRKKEKNGKKELENTIK